MSNDRTKTIKKLNILQKLLSQDLVALRRSLGDTEVVKEVNAEVKQFLAYKMDELLGKSAPAESVFSPEAVVVLQELAKRVLQKSRVEAVPPQPEDPPDPPAEGEVGSSVSHRPISPVMQALRQHGFDPKAPVEERVRAMKLAEQKRKEEK